ncbi:hypothetical protein EUX98_g2729 [Antrodiella citrinella]|uniref:Fungal-type protein kinase domain-containing protein n=1 Tax=Antrodiella citrinella TaxID=2447956 RepID=A0A4S4MZM9_9APHY|nr:hypothetical protein EUX98_g2729 [Antrodiella citrinella]
MSSLTIATETPVSSGPTSPSTPILGTVPDVQLPLSQDHTKPNQPSIRRRLQGKIIRDIDVPEFIYYVWGFDQSMIRSCTASSSSLSPSPSQSQASSSITIRASFLNKYAHSLSLNDFPGFLKSSAVILAIVSDVRAQLELPADGLPHGQFYSRDAQDGQNEEGQRDMPAVVFSPQWDDEWDMVGTFIHVTKKDLLAGDVKNNVVVEVGQYKCLPQFSCSPPSVFCYDKSPNYIPFKTSPRKRVNLLAPESMDVDTIHRKADLEPLSDDELDAAQHIFSLLHNGMRSFASGVDIHNTTVTLYYGDHSGLIKSQSFDFMERPDLLVLVVAAISSAHSTALGFLPSLHILENKGEIEVEGSKIKIPLAFDADRRVSGPWRFVVDTSDSSGRKVTYAGDAVARWNAIIPVRALKCDNAPALSPETDLVYTYGWEDSTHVAEDETIVDVRATLREKKLKALNHIVELICSASALDSTAGLPRAFLGEVEGAFTRVFRSMVLVDYQPIASLATGADFKQVVVDGLRAHHWVWQYAAVLHRNITSDSIKYYIRDDRVVGVLCNFDKARPRADIQEDLDREESTLRRIVDHGARGAEVPTFKANHGGDNLFVSCELLSKNYVPVHTYRHDLESFFYLLVTHCAVHNPEDGTYGEVRPWARRDALKVGLSKADFLTALDDSDEGRWHYFYAKFFCGAHAEYDDIIDDWMVPLRQYFVWSGVAFQEDCLLTKGTLVEAEWRILEKLREVAILCPEISYGRFMKSIGAQLDCDCEECVCGNMD